MQLVGVHNPYAVWTEKPDVALAFEPPDVTQLLSRNRWLTPDDLEDIRVSIELAVLEKEFNYKFKYSGGWGDWPAEEVQKARTVFRSWQTLLGIYRFGADGAKRAKANLERAKALEKAIPPPKPEEQAKEAEMQASVMNDLFG